MQHKLTQGKIYIQLICIQMSAARGNILNITAKQDNIQLTHFPSSGS
jgi:hypothetical protein